MGYRIDCQLWEVVAVQVGIGVLFAFDGHGWPRIKKEKKEERGHQQLILEGP